MNASSRAYLLIATLALGATVVRAQDPNARVERLLNPRTTAIGVVAHYWTFGDSLFDPAGSSVRVKRAGQITVPVMVNMSLGPYVGLDVASAYGYGAAEIETPDGQRIGLRLAGPSDTRVRATIRLLNAHVLLVGGINLPTGVKELDSEQLSALRVLAAPAFAMSPPQATAGGGGTAGIVLTQQSESWGFALGTSYERRGSYNPLAAIEAGAPTPDLDPGEALHVTLGADGRAGSHRLTLNLSGDFYTDDVMRLDASQQQTITLGPTFTAVGQVDFATSRFREFTFYLSDRFRQPYKSGGATVAGSSGNYLDAGFHGAYPLTRIVDFTSAIELRQQSGLDVDASITTASARSAGVALGFAFRGSRVSLSPYVRGDIGTIDPGTGAVRMTGISGGLLFTTH